MVVVVVVPRKFVTSRAGADADIRTYVLSHQYHLQIPHRRRMRTNIAMWPATSLELE